MEIEQESFHNTVSGEEMKIFPETESYRINKDERMEYISMDTLAQCLPVQIYNSIQDMTPEQIQQRCFLDERALRKAFQEDDEHLLNNAYNRLMGNVSDLVNEYEEKERDEYSKRKRDN